MTERVTTYCEKCGKTLAVEPARPGETAKRIHIDTGRQDCG